MSVHLKSGGAGRDALLRVWFLFFLWVFVAYAVVPGLHGLLVALTFGAALTFLLVYWQNRLAGIVGFLVVGTAVVFALPPAYSAWSSIVSATLADGARGRPSLDFVRFATYRAAVAFVPLVVIAVHFNFRHQLLRGFQARDKVRGRRFSPSSYYLVTRR